MSVMSGSSGRDENAAANNRDVPGSPSAARPEYVVELTVFVEADSETDAEVLGERAAREAMRAVTPRSAGTARVVSVIVSDVRSSDA